MNKNKVLYIFTSGTLDSSNNNTWIENFDKFSQFDISLVIQEGGKQKTINNPICFATNKNHKSVFKKINNLFRIVSFIKKQNPDIIHIHGAYYLFLVFPLFLIKKKYKLIYNVWGNDISTLYYKSWVYKKTINWLLSKADLIWCNWDAMSESLHNRFRQYSKKIKTILWGVEKKLLDAPSKNEIKLVREKFGISDSTFLMVYVKGFIKSNNHKYLLNEISKIDREINYKLILLGPKNNLQYIEELEKVIVELNLEGKVLLCKEFINENELHSLISAANLCFSIPSKDQLSRTIFESLLLGTDIILSDILPYRLLIKKFGFSNNLVNLNKNSELKNLIIEKMKLQSKIDLSKERDIICEKYIFENNISNYEEIYFSLLQEKI